MIKAALFINGTPLKKESTQSMTYSDFPMGLVYKRFTLRY
jgi:hypothetical protein